MIKVCKKSVDALIESLRIPNEGEIIIRGEIWARVDNVCGNTYDLEVLKPEYLKRRINYVHHFDVDKRLDLPLTCGSCPSFCGNEWCCVKDRK